MCERCVLLGGCCSVGVARHRSQSEVARVTRSGITCYMYLVKLYVQISKKSRLRRIALEILASLG